MVRLLIVLAACSVLGGCLVPMMSQVPMDEFSTREEYRRERVREQQLEHGAGGCAPNFATGGCL